MRDGDPLATCRNLSVHRVTAALGYRREPTDRAGIQREGSVVRRHRPGPGPPTWYPHRVLTPASGAVPSMLYAFRPIFIRTQFTKPILTP